MLYNGIEVFRKSECMLGMWAFPERDTMTRVLNAKVDVGPVLAYSPDPGRFSWQGLEQIEKAPDQSALVDLEFVSGDTIRIHAACKVYAKVMGTNGSVRPARLAQAVDSSPVEVYRVKVKKEGGANGEGWEFALVTDKVKKVTPVRKDPQTPHSPETQVGWYRARGLVRAYIVANTLLVR